MLTRTDTDTSVFQMSEEVRKVNWSVQEGDTSWLCEIVPVATGNFSSSLAAADKAHIWCVRGKQVYIYLNILKQHEV